LPTLPYTDLWGHPVIFIPQLSACSKPNRVIPSPVQWIYRLWGI
jgi:hypothetical protein